MFHYHFTIVHFSQNMLFLHLITLPVGMNMARRMPRAGLLLILRLAGIFPTAGAHERLREKKSTFNLFIFYFIFSIDPVVNAGLLLKECVIKIVEHRNRLR